MFATEAGVAKERFSHAKTLFGLVMVSSFLLLSFLVVISVAKVWGWPISPQDILQLMREPIMLKGTKNPITILSLLEIVGFILIGFLFSYALEQFVFSKVFDLLLVEVGIQHTIIRITQYIVIAIAIFIGFQNVGLEKIIGYAFTALALSIGWYIKEPISDFFAYFIILVQRPIKIGDFVRLDTEIEGVVRKITARSVVLRRKNSVMLVIPNSFVVQRVINNWNYIRTFVAFDDMRITISYSADPEQVRVLLLGVLNDHPRILKTPKPIVWLDQFGENGYVFLVRGFLSSTYTLDMWEIASEVRFGIVQTLKKHNIQIAIPIRFVTNNPSISQQTKPGDSTPAHFHADLK
jgi:small-conductance mechanosensitive channel